MNLAFKDEFVELWHGHCLSKLVNMSDDSVHAIITDPPYGVAYESNKPRKGGQFTEIHGDKEADFSILSEFYRVLKNDSACYVFTRWDVEEVWKTELEKVGFTVKNELIWDKGGFAMGDLDGDWARTHENILFCTKGDHSINSPRPRTVISVSKVTPSEMVHPNEKPVAVWYAMIKASTKPGDLVFDPYSGSGSSLLACRQLGRRAIGCEIDEHYTEVSSFRLGALQLIATPE